MIKRPKIVITDGKTIAKDNTFFNPLREIGELTVYDLSDAGSIPERIADCDIILCNKNQFNQSNLQYAKKLKYIGLFATGYNNIDIGYCRKRGITVCNAGSYSTEAVAQHTFALILNFYSKIREYADFCANGGWQKSDVFSPFIYRMNELSGKTIGIVGYGHIGKRVGELARAFGMKVLVNTRSERSEEGVTFVDFETLVRNSDVVTVHCPLNEASAEMFNEKAFRMFKKSAYFVNTARGGVINEQALADALNEGYIAGAAVDCLTIEPMSNNCALMGAKNITFTPHVAWAMDETRERLLSVVCNNIKNYLNGTPENVVT